MRSYIFATFSSPQGAIRLVSTWSQFLSMHRALILQFSGFSFCSFQIRRQLISDFNQLARRMRIPYIYHDQNTEQHPFHMKSSWIPPIQRSFLETYLEEVKIKLAETPLVKPKNNLPPGEQRALKELINNKEIILKKAEKGTTTVVMNRENKINEGQIHLDDRNNYQPLDNQWLEIHSSELNTSLPPFAKQGA